MCLFHSLVCFIKKSMVKKGKTNRFEKKVKAQSQKSSVLETIVFLYFRTKGNVTTSAKKIIKKHRDYLRGLEKRREECILQAVLMNRLILANRATNNKHAKELEALEKQILEMKARITSEQSGEAAVKSRAKKQ